MLPITICITFKFTNAIVKNQYKCCKNISSDHRSVHGRYINNSDSCSNLITRDIFFGAEPDSNPPG